MASKCRSKSQRHLDEQANVAEAKQPLVLTCKQGANTEANNIWYLDTACSNHMTGQKYIFSFLDESVQGQVNFGNQTKVLVKGKGDISIHSMDGTNVTIVDVFYVPDLHWNLLSLGQQSEKGHKIVLQNGFREIKGKNDKPIARVKMTKNRVFPLSIHTKYLMNLQTMIKDSSWI